MPRRILIVVVSLPEMIDVEQSYVFSIRKPLFGVFFPHRRALKSRAAQRACTRFRHENFVAFFPLSKGAILVRRGKTAFSRGKSYRLRGKRPSQRQNNEATNLLSLQGYKRSGTSRRGDAAVWKGHTLIERLLSIRAGDLQQRVPCRLRWSCTSRNS